VPEQSLRDVLGDVRRASRNLAVATARLTKRIASKAEVAAQNPTDSAKKAAHRLAKELEAAANEVEKILRDL